MRILAIRGKNLASLEGEFVIDFTAEPLRSAGIFAITGNTGAGKSTLLDALCLALFDDTPRINQASENNIQISDVQGKTINQKDCRNILRRGASEGYAEVDFVGLSGQHYRSRWSVRRARDRADGLLQQSEIRLTRLADHTEEPGRKTELLTRISGLIGLSFEQFTRAVLLAQGDFATFLKANQKEKAELLEKLTGTDIYSKVSKQIYERTKVAEQDVKLVQERIKGITLLAPEQREALVAERSHIGMHAVRIREEISLLRAKLDWISENEQLQADMQQAVQQVQASSQALEQAADRHHYLAKVDAVQDIRGCVTQLQDTQTHLAQYQQELHRQVQAHDSLATQYNEAATKATACQQQLSQQQEQATLLAPLIKQAHALDVQLAEAAKLQHESQAEQHEALDTYRKRSEVLLLTQEQLTQEQSQQVQRAAWFEQHGKWSEIVNRADLLISLIEDATAAHKQRLANGKTLEQVSLALANEQRQQEALLQEQERLNTLLPAEIAALRLQLSEGLPCPVCGSLHHPAGAEQGQSEDATKLDEAKKKTAAQLTQNQATLEARKAEHIRLQAMVDSYAAQYTEATERLGIYLQQLPGWQKHLEQGDLAQRIKTFVDTWKQHEQQQAEGSQRIATLETTLAQEQNNLQEKQKQLQALEQKLQQRNSTHTTLHTERQQLLQGRPADQVEQASQQQIKTNTDLLAQLTEHKTTLHSAQQKHRGTMQQLEQTIQQTQAQQASLQAQANAWLAAHGQGIDLQALALLLAKDAKWIQDERAALTQLHHRHTSAQATLAERNKTLDKHHLLEAQPEPEESMEHLQADLLRKETEVETQTTRGGEIDMLLTHDAQNSVQRATYMQEAQDKEELAEHWRKLNDLLGSSDGNKFRQLAQGYTLDTLLAYANKQLEQLSSRYQLQRVPDTLALQVVDLDMLGEIRTVHSLSGGESFLLSLALALGLSALSSNRMQIESLFIDEGFGSLDSDTLRTAMDALEQLQTQGRKIGVISHVAEMNERIATKVQVVRASNGRSRIVIVG